MLLGTLYLISNLAFNRGGAFYSYQCYLGASLFLCLCLCRCRCRYLPLPLRLRLRLPLLRLRLPLPLSLPLPLPLLPLLPLQDTPAKGTAHVLADMSDPDKRFCTEGAFHPRLLSLLWRRNHPDGIRRQSAVVTDTTRP